VSPIYWTSTGGCLFACFCYNQRPKDRFLLRWPENENQWGQPRSRLYQTARDTKSFDPALDNDLKPPPGLNEWRARVLRALATRTSGSRDCLFGASLLLWTRNKGSGANACTVAIVP